jgi:hypothetical protein
MDFRLIFQLFLFPVSLIFSKGFTKDLRKENNEFCLFFKSIPKLAVYSFMAGESNMHPRK